jgi:hypothetical protein
MDGIGVSSTGNVQMDIVAVRLLEFCTTRSVDLTMTLQAIDTGTTLIYVPDSIAAQFYAMVCYTCHLTTYVTIDAPTDSWSEDGCPIRSR